MRAILNAMSERAMRATDRKAHSTPGIVTSYNPNTYSVKVTLQPEGVETGWLPLLSQQVGNGWGLYSPPAIGDLVHVLFTDGDIEAGVVVGAYYNNQDVPLPVPSQEVWMVHKSGSFLKFHNDGTVELTSIGELTITAPHTTHNGDMQLNGSLRVSEDISDKNTAHGTLANLRDTYNGHHHGGVRSGGDSTATPTETQ